MTSDLEARELKRFADEKKNNFIRFLREVTADRQVPEQAAMWIKQLQTIDSITLIIVLKNLLRGQSIDEYCDLKLQELGLTAEFTAEQRDKFKRYLSLFYDLAGDDSDDP